jgi:Tol biopolymer transport system component
MEDGELETLDLAVTCVPRIDEGPGEILVLTSRSFADQDFNLYLMRNGVRQRLTDHIGDELAPEITQAGDRILFLQSTEAGRSLKLLDRVTRQETLLPSQGVDRAIWSPDGSRIVLSRGGRLYRVAADGSGEFPLTTGGDDRDPYWSPDGTRIAFTRANTVYLVNADGTGLRQLSIDKRLAGPWSPDGRSLAVTVLDEVCSYYSYYCYYYGPTLTPSDLRILDLETLKETPLTNTPGAAEWSPAWSLDGQRVYFISSQNGATDLYAMALSGTSAVNLTQSPDLENWVSVAVVQGSPSHVRAR